MPKHKNKIPKQETENASLKIFDGERLYKILIITYDNGRRGLKLMSKMREDGLLDAVVYRGDMNPDGSHRTKEDLRSKEGITITELEKTFSLLFSLAEQFPDTHVEVQDYSSFVTFKEQMAAIHNKQTGVLAAVHNLKWDEFRQLPGALKAPGFPTLEKAFEHFHKITKEGFKTRLIKITDLPENESGKGYRVIEVKEM